MLWLLINGIARVFFSRMLIVKIPLILVVFGIENIIKIEKPPKTHMTQCGPIEKETRKSRTILTKLWRRLRKSSFESGMIQKSHILKMDQENWVHLGSRKRLKELRYYYRSFNEKKRPTFNSIYICHWFDRAFAKFNNFSTINQFGCTICNLHNFNSNNNRSQTRLF